MRPTEIKRLEGELNEFIDSMTADMGRPERRRAMGWCVRALRLDGERKSREPMAGRLVDDRSEIEAMRQRLQECVSISAWSEADLLARLARKLDSELPDVQSLVIDDTGHPKKGKHSVGVARQYSGTLGRIDNCQVAVSLHLAGESGSGCIAYRLYLPEEWATDVDRRRKAGVPEEVGLQPKWEIALQQIDAALAAGVRKHIVLADAAYGDNSAFRSGLVDRGLGYVGGVVGKTMIWPPGSRPRQMAKKRGRGRPPTRHVDAAHPPVSIEQLALGLRYRDVRWREGSRGWQKSRFAAVRVRTAHRHQNGKPPSDEQWLLCHWPEDSEAPIKYWLGALPATTSIGALVRLGELPG